MKSTTIGWTHSTINGSSGCDGCELWNNLTRSCYAGTLHESRLAKSLPALYASKFDEVRMIPGRFARAAAWGLPTAEEIADKPWFAGHPRHIFVGDMGDFLSEEVTDEFLTRELLGAITSKGGRRHVWQLLTKRPDRLAALSVKWGGLPDNVVAMTTVTNQRTADLRIPALLKVRCKVKGLSCEPLLGPVDLRLGCGPSSTLPCRCIAIYGCKIADQPPGTYCSLDVESRNFSGISWVIAGGESGVGARPMDHRWAIDLRDQCASAGVSFFFKQWGGVRKEPNGRELDGRTYSEMPRMMLDAA